MLNKDRSDEILDGEFVDLDEPAHGELVPLTQSLHVSPRLAPRPDPTFITHLIATADRLWREPDPALRRGLPDPADHLAIRAKTPWIRAWVRRAFPAAAESWDRVAVPATGFPANGFPLKTFSAQPVRARPGWAPA